jgi:hypothetical protein
MVLTVVTVVGPEKLPFARRSTECIRLLRGVGAALVAEIARRRTKRRDKNSDV